MFSSKLIFCPLAVIFGLALAAPDKATAPAYGAPPVEQKGMPYEFGYRVDDDLSANHYGHSESSDGAIVTGEYRVLLPDGRTQIVKYHADKSSGFVADVTYEGEARAVPSYQAPRPSPSPRPVVRPPPPPPSASPVYGAPAQPSYASPAPPAYGAPVASAYDAPEEGDY